MRQRGKKLVLAPVGVAQPVLALAQLLVAGRQLVSPFAHPLFEQRERPFALALQARQAGHVRPDHTRDGGREGERDHGGDHFRVDELNAISRQLHAAERQRSEERRCDQAERQDHLPGGPPHRLRVH